MEFGLFRPVDGPAPKPKRGRGRPPPPKKIGCAFAEICEGLCRFVEVPGGRGPELRGYLSRSLRFVEIN